MHHAYAPAHPRRHAGPRRAPGAAAAAVRTGHRAVPRGTARPAVPRATARRTRATGSPRPRALPAA
ncbi:hypothetical protein ABZ869_16580 [Streptomyces sp. NPDC046928]|uniref:hypothetical protein n=1 Tax=Streptomyces sp. NPDC046928 TaxID=3155021 RepID=UPI0034044397